MKCASFNLCKELYELTKWSSGDLKGWFGDFHDENNLGYFVSDGNGSSSISWICPAYDLGYLLRKLPTFYDDGKMVYLLTIQPNPIGPGWQAHYRFASRTPNSSNTGSKFRQEAATPEDAACKLAIDLFKKEILK
jgi:hypothetical protein